MNGFLRLLNVAAAVGLVTPLFALAQQAARPAAAPQIMPVEQPLIPPPPPSWQQGRPDSMRSSTLAPNPPGLTAKPASEIKLDQMKLDRKSTRLNSSHT